MATGSKREVSKLRSYLELCRASYLPSVWTNVWAASLLSFELPGVDFKPVTLGPLIALSIALSLFYLGGMALNDVLDVEEDRLKKPLRPIPSGRISRAGAAAFALSLFASGWLGLVAFSHTPAYFPVAGSWKAPLAGLVLIATIVLYDSLHQKSWLTVLLMASCRFLVFVISALAFTGMVGRVVLFGAAVQFLYIVTLTVVARWEKSGDRAFKIPPIPWLLAGISIVDGILIAVFVSPFGLIVGLVGAGATRLLQTQVRGDSPPIATDSSL